MSDLTPTEPPKRSRFGCLFGHDWRETSRDKGWNLFHVVREKCARCGVKRQYAERWEDVSPGCDGSLGQ